MRNSTHLISSRTQTSSVRKSTKDGTGGISKSRDNKSRHMICLMTCCCLSLSAGSICICHRGGVSMSLRLLSACTLLFVATLSKPSLGQQTNYPHTDDNFIAERIAPDKRLVSLVKSTECKRIVWQNGRRWDAWCPMPLLPMAV